MLFSALMLRFFCDYLPNKRCLTSVSNFISVGEESIKVKDLSIPSLLSLNCLIVAANNDTFNQIFTTTSTSTSTSTIEPTTTVPDETTLPSVGNADVVQSATRELARKLRQLGTKKSKSQLSDSKLLSKTSGF